jgi:hypothetical protein
LTASDIVKLFNSCVSMTPPTVPNMPAVLVDEILILSFNIRCSDVVDPNEPVERVILPSESRQVQRMCNNATDAVLCQENI